MVSQFQLTFHPWLRSCIKSLLFIMCLYFHYYPGSVCSAVRSGNGTSTHFWFGPSEREKNRTFTICGNLTSCLITVSSAGSRAGWMTPTAPAHIRGNVSAALLLLTIDNEPVGYYFSLQPEVWTNRFVTFLSYTLCWHVWQVDAHFASPNKVMETEKLRFTRSHRETGKRRHSLVQYYILRDFTHRSRDITALHS